MCFAKNIFLSDYELLVVVKPFNPNWFIAFSFIFFNFATIKNANVKIEQK